MNSYQNMVRVPGASYFPMPPQNQPQHLDRRAPPTQPAPQVHTPSLPISGENVRSNLVSVEMMGSGSLPNLSVVERDEKPLIEFSPPRDHKNSENSELVSSAKKSPSKRGNLDLTYNEMHFSQDDLERDVSIRDVLYNEQLNSSASSESISLNLEEAKRGRNMKELTSERKPSTNLGSSRRASKKSAEDGDKKYLEIKENSLETTKSARKSLDLEYQEIRFSSNDFSTEDLTNKSSRKFSGSSKHKKPTDRKQRSLNSSVPEVSEHGGPAINSATVSRKHSGHAKTNAQIRGDLEAYKRSSKTGSNSSVNISSMNSSNSRRRSFQRAPSSLDLDRSRMDALNFNDVNGKRRSFFSVFRSSTDKK